MGTGQKRRKRRREHVAKSSLARIGDGGDACAAVTAPPSPPRTALLSRRRLVAGGSLALLVAACGRKTAPENQAAEGAAPAGPRGTIEWAVAGDWRGPDRQRDAWRHPVETLKFFGLEPGMTVVEMWPGAGWYTQILAPFLAATGGKLYTAGIETPADEAAASQLDEAYRKTFEARRALYGKVEFTTFGTKSGPLTPPGTADLVLFMRNIHDWMAAGLAEKAFRDAFEALKPGGVLGVEQHRAEAGSVQDALASDGYVQEAYVKQMAAEAGFKFDKASDINANPKDTKSYPFGVWTLPPTRRSAPVGQPADPAFDHAKYDAVGESDRMTLRFVKPG